MIGRLFFWMILLSFLTSCNIEDESGPQPEDTFVRYLGQLADQEAKDIEPIFAEDGSLEGYVILGTQQLQDSARNFYVILTDPQGNNLRDTAFGISGFPFGDLDGDGDPTGSRDQISSEDRAVAIEVLDDGFLVVGTSTIDNGILGIDDYQIITYTFLNSDLSRASAINRIEADTANLDFITRARNSRDLIAHDAKVLSDNSILIVGAKENTDGDLDFYYTKFSVNGGAGTANLIWENTQAVGLGNDEVFIRAFEGEDNNITMFGYSNDLGANGEQGVNVTFYEINENGTIINANSHGIEEPPLPNVQYDEILTDVIEKPGGFLAVGTSTISEQNYAFFMDIDRNGIANRKDTISSLFGQSEGETFARLQTEATAVTATLNNDFVIVGRYPNFRTELESRGAEMMLTRVNQIGETVEDLEANFGVGDGNDTAVDAITLSDGKIVVLATIDFGGGVRVISMIKLNDTGDLDEK